MCIVVYKKEGVGMPSTDILKKCFQNNSDGAGYMFAHHNTVIIRKGYMTFKAFDKALKSDVKAFGDRCPYVLHFRISTQGGTRRDCTHPFPVSESMDELRRLHCTTHTGVAHNGIISLTSNYKKQITYSDTMEFITDYLSLIIGEKNYYYKNARSLKLINRLADSKLAILSADGHCELIGTGWIEDEKIFYSNGSYRESYTYYSFPYNKYELYDNPEVYYNHETGLYEFDDLCCPKLVYDLDDYCSMCMQYPRCRELTCL